MDFFFLVKSISSFFADCFFPTMKHPNMTRLAFNHAQVNTMGKVLRNNFDYPKICLLYELYHNAKSLMRSMVVSSTNQNNIQISINYHNSNTFLNGNRSHTSMLIVCII